MICDKCGYIMLDTGERGYVCDPPSIQIFEWYKCARCEYEKSKEVRLDDRLL